jgi:hypothetical protein
MTRTRRDEHALWRPPTRRTFIAMIGAGIAALAVRSRWPGGGDDREADDPPRTWAGTTRWIGHC